MKNKQQEERWRGSYMNLFNYEEEVEMYKNLKTQFDLAKKLDLDMENILLESKKRLKEINRNIVKQIPESKLQKANILINKLDTLSDKYIESLCLGEDYSSVRVMGTMKQMLESRNELIEICNN